jgi:flagellar biosynthesis protein FlhA
LNKKTGLIATIRASSDWFIPTGAVALVFVMLVPLPSFVLDLLLTFSITASVLVLLTAIQILRPVQFSVFPSLILLLTLMRLSLDLASTRRILLHGNEGPTAAGKVIEAFGQFVVGGNYIVGFYSVSRGQSRRSAHRGSHGTLHTRCPARQADGYRLRSQHRPHQRRSGAPAP